jgi:hypothetical protein
MHISKIAYISIAIVVIVLATVAAWYYADVKQVFTPTGQLMITTDITQTVNQHCIAISDTNFSVKIYDSSLKLVKTLNLSAAGTASVHLSAGTYAVYGSNEIPGLKFTPDMWTDTPQQTSVTIGKTSTVHLTAHYICNAQ